MKIQSYILLIFSLLLCSCEDTFHLLEGAQFTDNPHYMLADKTSATFNYSGYCTSQDRLDGKIEVYTTFTTWKVTNVPSWIEVSPISGGWAAGRDLKVVHIAVSKNTSIDSRSATIHIVSTSQGYTKDIPITVTQTGSEAFLTASTSYIFSEYSGITQTIHITSNTKWQASTTASWIHISNNQYNTGNGKFDITTDKNNTQYTRKATIDILYYTANGASITKKIDVTQGYIY